MSYSKGYLTKEIRLYVAKSITDSGREIKCEDCGALENLEFHHKKYAKVKIKDIRILCSRCHRNAENVKENRRSGLKTIFEKGKRFCQVSDFQFQY